MVWCCGEAIVAGHRSSAGKTGAVQVRQLAAAQASGGGGRSAEPRHARLGLPRYDSLLVALVNRSEVLRRPGQHGGNRAQGERRSPSVAGNGADLDCR